MSENQTEVPPRPHVAHDSHPAQALEEKFAQGTKVSDSFDGVGQQFDFETLFRDQAADEEIIRRTVRDGGVAAEACEMFARRDDCLAEGELHSIQLARDENAGVKIADHADGLELLDECVFLRGDIEASDRANVCVAERRDDGAEIVGPYTNVAVVDDEHFVLRFVHEARELDDFVVGRGVAGDVNYANALPGKIAFEFFDDFQDGFVAVADAEEKFVVGIVLLAIAGEVFVRLVVEATYRLEITDRGSEIQSLRGLLGMSEKLPGTIECEEIINERNRREAEEDVGEVSRMH